MDKQQILTDLRQKIDQLDKEIQYLITQRATLVLEVAMHKKNKLQTINYYSPEREAQVLKAVKARNFSALSDEAMTIIFREIISACLALEQKLTIAYLGPEGTFSEEAVYQHFGRSINTLSSMSIEDVFAEVVKRNAHYGVVPVENSSNGVISATLDMLYQCNLKICGEVEMPIHHQLMAKHQAQHIEVIYAHQQALDQCRRWLFHHYPKARLVSLASNALAAKTVKEVPNSAAIASNVALELYQLNKIANNIEDAVGNRTRFLILGRELIAPSGHDKTSLLIITKHEAGALFNALEPFKEANINILQLAHHPLPNTKWEYLFFLDIAGHREDLEVLGVLKIIESKVRKLIMLGSYPSMI